MRPGVVLPMALFQCPRPDVSLGNGGSVNSGRRQDFENHSSPTVRVALKLFESFPNQNDVFGLTKFFGINGADICPCGTTDDDGNIIIICIIWIVIIAKERAEIINLFVEYARKLGVEYVFIASVGGTSTGVDLIFRYLNLNLFDKVVMKVTHAGNAITRRHHRGHPWSDETDQKVVVTRSLTKVCNALVSFCEMANIELPSHPLQDMIDDRRLRYVVDLSPEDERQWDKRAQGIKDGTIKLGGLYNYKYNQTEEAIQKRHDAAVKAYQTNADNDTGIYHFTNDPSPEGAAKRSNATKKSYKDNTRLHEYLHDQSPKAKKKRSDSAKKRTEKLGKEGMSTAGVQAAITRGHANWSPYDHNGTPMNPAAELRARAADPRFQGTHRGMPCVQWSKVQDSDDCIYLNDGNDKRGDKATEKQCARKWTSMP